MNQKKMLPCDICASYKCECVTSSFLGGKGGGESVGAGTPAGSEKNYQIQ